MNGILKGIQKKTGNSKVEEASRIVVRPSSKFVQGQSNNPETVITSTSENFGSKRDFVDELKEAVTLKAEISSSNQIITGKTTRIKLIRTESTDATKSILQDDVPAWVGQLQQSTPQVDMLVPAGRRALNDLITEDTTRSELPQLIVKAINIASQKLTVGARFSQRDIDSAIAELTNLMLGKGPIIPLYEDPWVTDIYLDGHQSIKCIRRGKALETPFKFRSPEEYEAYIGSMLQGVERVLNLSSPIVDCVLDDPWRSRVNAVHGSLLDRGESALVVRVPRLQHITFFDLIQTQTLSPQMAAWLAELVAMGEANILVVGATGSGKTVFTTALLSAVGSDERICTIEDVPEIFVPTAHLEKLVVRPENSQGKGSVTMYELLRAALRRAPHRIVVGEIRDKEGPLFLKALETGHLGSVATIHARSAKESLWRLLDVVAAHEHAPQESIQRRISRSVNIIICMQKINGRPCMVDVSEVKQPIAGEFIVNQLIRYEGEDSDNRRNWRIMTKHSDWMDKVAARGIELNPGSQLLAPDPTSTQSRV